MSQKKSQKQQRTKKPYSPLPSLLSVGDFNAEIERRRAQRKQLKQLAEGADK